MHGPRNIVPQEDSENRDGKVDTSFHTRPHEEFMATVQSGDNTKWFNQLVGGVNIVIGSRLDGSYCYVSPMFPKRWIGGNEHAATTYPLNHPTASRDGHLHGDLQGILMAIYLEILQPLLREDLEASERLAQQLHVACLVSVALTADIRLD